MSSSTDDPEHREEEERETPPAEDEDTGARIAAVVKLEQVAVTTGEEEEDPILNLKAKLYRFDKGGNQWKERGVGNVKLLKHKESGKVRLLMRQSKTLKICANHLVYPGMNVQEHCGSGKSCVWHASDFADDELKDELFCIRFASVGDCKTFRSKVQEVAETQDKKEEREEVPDTAELLEKLSVEDRKTEVSKQEDVAREGKEDKQVAVE